jgi:hypothetical protein
LRFRISEKQKQKGKEITTLLYDDGSCTAERNHLEQVQQQWRGREIERCIFIEQQ